MDTPEVPPQLALLRLLTGFHVTQLLSLAARLNIADALANGPQTADELARATGAQPDALYRALRALANVGVFEERAERTFALTPLGALLQTTRPDSLRAQAIFLGGDPYQAWAELPYVVATGAPAFDHLYGAPHFEYLAAHPASNDTFNQAMSVMSRRVAAAVVAAYDFTRADRVVDVGGGQGMLLATILQAHPSLRGALFDLPHVVASAAPVLRAANVADRCDVIGGDFFAMTPPDGDILTLHHILHDWDNEHSVRILQACAQALRPQGKVLVIEAIIEPGANAAQNLFLDMNMMVMNGGRERTAAEYERLFTAAGLRLTRIIPLRAEARIIEGQRAQE
jgi:SAM-dependent methyltransferase